MNRDARQVLTEWLVLSAQGGSEAAFRDLHDLWRDDVRRVALARVERADVATEIGNDVWVEIARGVGRLVDPACFPRWMFRIVERRCVDWIRRQDVERRHARAAEAAADQLAPAPAAPAAVPEEVARLREAITRLPPEQQELLRWYYERDLSVDEIAEVLRLPIGTVKSRLHTLRETLKRILNRTSL